jgi:hypothetical protein
MLSKNDWILMTKGSSSSETTKGDQGSKIANAMLREILIEKSVEHKRVMRTK